MITFIIKMVFVYMSIKTISEYMQQSKILKIIYQRYVDDVLTYEEASYAMNDMTHLKFRLFDWGYENIVPKEVYDKIKPYL